MNNQLKESFHKAQIKTRNAITKSLQNHPTREELQFITPKDYLNLKLQIEKIQEIKPQNRIANLESQILLKKAESEKNLKALEKKIQKSLDKVKLEFADFRAQVLKVQQKTVAEAERVVSELSERAYEQDSMGRLQDKKFKQHLEKMIGKEKEATQLEQAIAKLRKDLARVESLMLHKSKVGEEKYGKLRNEVDQRIEKIRSGDFVKREVSKQVQRAMSLQQDCENSKQDELLR